MDPTDLFGLRGKTVMVTGGGQGIGRSICEHFAAVGATVGVLDINAGTAAEVAAALPAARAIHCDVRDKLALAAAADALERDAGPIAVWVNNAGGIIPGATAALVDLERTVWDQIFELNLTALLSGSQIAAARMIERAEGGTIVNVSSFQGTNASPFMTPYGAAKAAVVHFTKSTALELAAYGIRVNAVAPTFILTPAAEREMSEVRRAASIKAIPLGRAGHPDDIAGIVLALSSRLASFITGQLITVDGGLGLTNARPHRGVIG